MKVAIYTAIVGDGRQLTDPPVVHKDVDYIAFTDQKPDCKVWQVRPILPFSIDPKYRDRRNAKLFKILPNVFLQEYDLTIWHDSTNYCLMPPLEIIATYLTKGDDLAVFKHRWRTCVYEEAQEVIRLDRDTVENVERQVNFYRSENYPERNGLYELGVIVRKKSESNNIMNLMWWEHICRFSSRDQISLPVVLRSINKTPVILSGNVKRNNVVPWIRLK